MEKRWSKEEIEESERRYQESRRVPNGQIPVRITNMNLEFRSISACARFLKVSDRTVRMIMNADEPVGDIQIEAI